jgi:hypothetical protein
MAIWIKSENDFVTGQHAQYLIKGLAFGMFSDDWGGAGDKLETKAWYIFKQQTKKGTSFIDCANIAIYKHFKMDAIFSFDKIYKRNKIKTLS